MQSLPLDGEDIWHVVSERTLQVARDYFDCPDLRALPLMGENVLGRSSRGSHWETRIMVRRQGGAGRTGAARARVDRVLH